MTDKTITPTPADSTEPKADEKPGETHDEKRDETRDEKHDKKLDGTSNKTRDETRDEMDDERRDKTRDEKHDEKGNDAVDGPTPSADQTTVSKPESKDTSKSTKPPPLALSPGDPLETAREFVKRRYTVKDTRTLQLYRGQFYDWDSRCYQKMSDDDLRKEVYEFLDGAVIAGTGGPKSQPKPFQPNQPKVNYAIDALRSVCLLPSDVEVPCWLDDNKVPVRNVLPCKNGLLNVETRKIYPHSPSFFSFSVLPVSYTSNPKEPKTWYRFLEGVWRDDQGECQLLQQMMGCFLTQDTRYQKMFLIVGPRRSGKGTIGRVIAALVGQENVVAPTLASLGTNFGLQPWIGKQLAIIADARFGGRGQHQVVERLLSISGEDNITVDRKYKEPWTGMLKARVLILTNELPGLPDPSGAMAGRFVVLPMTRSFYGKEDPDLTEKLLKELPGILDWALFGLRKLRTQAYFNEPPAAKDSKVLLEDSGSPVKAFVWDRCDLEAEQRVGTNTLYGAWCDWCKQQGRDNPGPTQQLGRALKAAFPSMKVRQGSDNKRFYEGIALRSSGDRDNANANQRAVEDSEHDADSNEDNPNSTNEPKDRSQRVGPRGRGIRKKKKKRIKYRTLKPSNSEDAADSRTDETLEQDEENEPGEPEAMGMSEERRRRHERLESLRQRREEQRKPEDDSS
jgi:putative DNA primase/helicase